MSTSAAYKTHTVTGLDDDTTYTFQIRASNPYGASAASDPVDGDPARPARRARELQSRAKVPKRHPVLEQPKQQQHHKVRVPPKGGQQRLRRLDRDSE